MAEAEPEPEPTVDLGKECACVSPDGLSGVLRCRHHYSYSFVLYGREYYGKTRASNHERAERIARKAYREILEAAGEPPLESRSLLEQFTDGYHDPDVPSEVRAKFAELQRLPIDTSWLDDVLEGPIDIARGPDVLRQPRVLAPIATFLWRESRDDFLKRATNHWDARVVEFDDVLRESGQRVKAPAPKPDLQRHIDWLIRYQVKGEPEPKIAARPPQRQSSPAAPDHRGPGNRLPTGRVAHAAMAGR